MTIETEPGFRNIRLVEDRLHTLFYEFPPARHKFTLSWVRTREAKRPLLILKVAGRRASLKTRCWLVRIDPIPRDIPGKDIPKPMGQERRNLETLAILRYNLGDML